MHFDLSIRQQLLALEFFGAACLIAVCAVGTSKVINSTQLVSHSDTVSRHQAMTDSMHDGLRTDTLRYRLLLEKVSTI